ncbi:hypothetical protein ACFL6X_05335 [Candidatus Latescibacterota bacterium]
MELRTEIANTRESILRRVERAARDGCAEEVMLSSRLLAAVEELLKGFDALEARFRGIQEEANGAHSIGLGPVAARDDAYPGSPGMSAKYKGEQRRQAFLADARGMGIAMERIRGVQYKSPKQQRVGIASASETEKYRDRWFLGLAPAAYDGFVLLCEARSGVTYRFIASTEFARDVVPRLSRDNAGQLKFHVTRKHGSFNLDVPGSGRVAIDGLLEQFENLSNRTPATDRQPSTESVPVSTPAETTADRTRGDGRPPTQEGYRELGRRGNENLRDYLLPVIKLMGSGNGYSEAFKQVAGTLDVRYNTVSAQCTRALGLTTAEFDRSVRNRQIVQVLKAKYPDQGELITRELR